MFWVDFNELSLLIAMDFGGHVITFVTLNVFNTVLLHPLFFPLLPTDMLSSLELTKMWMCP